MWKNVGDPLGLRVLMEWSQYCDIFVRAYSALPFPLCSLCPDMPRIKRKAVNFHLFLEALIRGPQRGCYQTQRGRREAGY